METMFARSESGNQSGDCHGTAIVLWKSDVAPDVGIWALKVCNGLQKLWEEKSGSEIRNGGDFYTSPETVDSENSASSAVL